MPRARVPKWSELKKHATKYFTLPRSAIESPHRLLSCLQRYIHDDIITYTFRWKHGKVREGVLVGLVRFPVDLHQSKRRHSGDLQSGGRASTTASAPTTGRGVWCGGPLWFFCLHSRHAMQASKLAVRRAARMRRRGMSPAACDAHSGARAPLARSPALRPPLPLDPLTCRGTVAAIQVMHQRSRTTGKSNTRTPTQIRASQCECWCSARP